MTAPGRSIRIFSRWIVALDAVTRQVDRRVLDRNPERAVLDIERITVAAWRSNGTAALSAASAEGDPSQATSTRPPTSRLGGRFRHRQYRKPCFHQQPAGQLEGVGKEARPQFPVDHDQIGQRRGIEQDSVRPPVMRRSSRTAHRHSPAARAGGRGCRLPWPPRRPAAGTAAHRGIVCDDFRHDRNIDATQMTADGARDVERGPNPGLLPAVVMDKDQDVLHGMLLDRCGDPEACREAGISGSLRMTAPPPT